MTMPLNRFVTFVKPYVNLLAGAIAALFVAKVNVLGIPGLDQGNAATWIAGALTWILTQGATQLGDLKWIKGHHLLLQGDAIVQAAALRAPAATVAAAPAPDDAHDALMAAGEELPTDAEEFASPPDQGARATPDAPLAR